MTKNERPVVLRYLAKRAKEGTKLVSRPAKEKEKVAEKEKESNLGLVGALTTAAVLQQQPNPSTTLLSNRPHPLPRQSNSAIPSAAKSAQPLRAQAAKSAHRGAATSLRAGPPVVTSQPPIRTQTPYSVVPPSSSARIVTNVGGSLPLSTTFNPPRAQVSRPQGFRPPAPSNPASSNPNHQVQSKRPNASMANTIHTNTSATDYASQAALLMSQASQAFPTQPAVVPPSRQAIFDWRLKETGWTNEQAHVLAEMQSSDLLRRMQQPSISTAQTISTSGDQATGIGFSQPPFPAGMASQHQNLRTSLPPTGQQHQGSHGQQSISYSPFSQTILSAQPSMPQTHLPTASGNITSNLTDKPPTAQVDMSDVLQFITLMAQQVNNVAPTTNLSNPTVPSVMSTTMGAFLTSSIPTATLTSFPQQALPQSNQIVASLPSGNVSWLPQFSVSGFGSGAPGLPPATTSATTEAMSETATPWMAKQVANTLVPAQSPQRQVSSKLQELRKLYQSESPDSVTNQYRTAFLKMENAKILQTIGILCKLILDGCRSPLGIDLPLEISMLIATLGDMIWEFYEVRRAERIEKICEATSFPPTLFSANEKIDVWAWDERRTQTAPPTFQQDPFKVIRFLWEQRDRYYQTLFHSDKGETVHQTSLTPALMQNPASSSSNPPIQPVIKDPKSKSLPALQVAENKPEMAPLLAAKAEHQDKEVVLISDDEQSDSVVAKPNISPGKMANESSDTAVRTFLPLK
ncbi:hypothetical protein BT69DRAFT_1285515 [Atractiella rhizophila]|nr:hypothetical protein BT69DRAFT_1285515 [Atractiella rhizophila]